MTFLFTRRYRIETCVRDMEVRPIFEFDPNAVYLPRICNLFSINLFFNISLWSLIVNLCHLFLLTVRFDKDVSAEEPVIDGFPFDCLFPEDGLLYPACSP